MRDSKKQKKATHGMSWTPTWSAWVNMRQRCSNKKSTSYQIYGGRGIKVCDRWLGPDGFENFFDDMGERPGKGYSLDRRDNDGDYTPENCRWASRSVQNRNRCNVILIRFDDRLQRLADVYEKIQPDICYNAIKWRIKSGMSPKNAFTLPRAQCGRPKKQQQQQEKQHVYKMAA